MTKKISSSWISHRQSAVIQWGKQQGKSFPHLLQWKNEIYIKQKLYLSVGGRGGEMYLAEEHGRNTSVSFSGT